MRRTLSVFAIVLCAAALPVRAADLYAHSDWAALASDRNAHKLGDSLTVLIYESSTAVNSASSSTSKNSSLGGQASLVGQAPLTMNFNQSANLGLTSGSNNSGSTDRSGGMVAEISAVVDDVYSNGDLHIVGAQKLNINGEETNIRVKGRLRQADISSSNTVLSSRLANAMIDYNGSGFVSRAGAPGIITRAFDWLGIP